MQPPTIQPTSGINWDLFADAMARNASRYPPTIFRGIRIPRYSGVGVGSVRRGVNRLLNLL